MLSQWVESPLASALAMTLVHSLWEGAAIALLLALALCVVHSSRARHLTACFAMLALAVAFTATFLSQVPAARSTHSIPTNPLLLAAPDLPDDHRVPSPGSIAEYLPWLTPFWIAGVLFFHIRALAGWTAARRLRSNGICHAPAEWQQRLNQLASALSLTTPVALVESCVAAAPVVAGWVRPVILVPVGLLSGLPVGQIEAILLHELSHIRRHDYLVNLIQIAIEGFLFYHPAVWWISSVIRTERENACDDMVVAVRGNAHEYALALTALEQRRAASSETAPQALPAATGGSLVGRVRRILAPAVTNPPPTAVPVLSASVLALSFAMAVAAWQAPAPAPKPDPYTAWIQEDVVYIVNDAERAAFLKLTTDEERQHFIEQFWLRRDPTPGTPENEFKTEHYRRIAFTNTRYSAGDISGWKTDRGRIYITFGPPDEIDAHPSGTVSEPPYEEWRYRHLEGIGDNVLMRFVDPDRTGRYRMTSDPNPTGGRRIVK